MFRSKNLIVSVICILGLGCATHSGDRAGVTYEPSGPGTIFPTIEMAAVDGLAYGYKSGLEENNAELSRGGTIVRVHGGYTYGDLVVASPLAPMQIRYKLGSRDVAHFRVYPRTTNSTQNLRNERISRTDRNIVDDRDPGHRPFFVLTPKLMVRAYRGDVVGTESIADLGASGWSESLAASQP